MEEEPSHIYYDLFCFLIMWLHRKKEILLYGLSEGRTPSNSHKKPPNVTSVSHSYLGDTDLVLTGALSSPGIVFCFIQSLCSGFLNYFLLNLKFHQQARGGNRRLSLSQEQSTLKLESKPKNREVWHDAEMFLNIPGLDEAALESDPQNS